MCEAIKGNMLKKSRFPYQDLKTHYSSGSHTKITLITEDLDGIRGHNIARGKRL